MHKADCYQCKYRGNVPGDAHSCCRFPGNNIEPLGFFDKCNIENAQKLNIIAERHGVENGWFFWPVNFDPVWLRNCNGYEKKYA